MRRTALYLLLPVFGALPAMSQSIPAYAIPSAKHYRESGVGNAHGRTGSASMTARALLGKDGNTTIEVTTGLLDSADTPPGTFKKIQLKPLDSDGNALFAQNFTPLSTGPGYYTFNWPSLYRHQQAQIQGNITGIDNRTDVVTVVDTVKMRPDLAFTKYKLPDSVLVNTPVILPANLVELNGDSAATTTCQLLIDGTVVDHADNVYVDAGGSVSCAFSYTFTTPGSHTVQVNATNVVPADWDLSNNSASGTINVISLNSNIAESGSVTFFDQTGGFPVSHTTSTQIFLGGTLENSYGSTSGSSGEQQNAATRFDSGGCVGSTKAGTYQFPVDVTYTESMDGAQAFSAKATAATGVTRTFVSGAGFSCGTAAHFVRQTGFGVADQFSFAISSGTYYDSSSNPIYVMQHIESYRTAGDVTYISTGFQCDLFGSCDNAPTNYYYWNTPSQSTSGTLVPVGSTWVPSITATDAGGRGFGGSLSASLFSTKTNTTTPDPCSTTGPDQWGYTYQNCNSTVENNTVTEGAASY